jgi:hypothetical protein
VAIGETDNGKSMPHTMHLTLDARVAALCGSGIADLDNGRSVTLHCQAALQSIIAATCNAGSTQRVIGPAAPLA